MKRKVLLFSTVGLAAGLVYALENNRRKQATANRESPSAPESSANGKAATNSDANPNDSAARGTSMARAGNGSSIELQPEAHQLDDHGTNQAEAAHILKAIRDFAFDASDEKLALALGRPTEEIALWANGDGLIDGDVVMKARALAMQRGVEVD
ncbi:MAG TPA: hypothetical protein VGO68_04870 [Pyrinomonadaceae bacterium]|nr:hypothetical protein [Pyrinomonadaceae bacterium]